jgi:hypothetical protein
MITMITKESLNNLPPNWEPTNFSTKREYVDYMITAIKHKAWIERFLRIWGKDYTNQCKHSSCLCTIYTTYICNTANTPLELPLISANENLYDLNTTLGDY